MAYNKWLYFIDGEDEEEAENEQENEVTVPAITPKKRRAQFIEIPQSVVKTANQDMNLSEKLLVESASERDRISEVSLIVSPEKATYRDYFRQRHPDILVRSITLSL